MLKNNIMKKLLFILGILIASLLVMAQSTTITQNVYGSQVKDAINSNFMEVSDSLNAIRSDLGTAS